MNIYFWGFFYSSTFIRRIWSCNIPWFIYCVLFVSSLSRPWFIQWFNCVGFITFRCIYCFIGCLQFLCFGDFVDIFFSGIRGVMASSTTFCFGFPYLSTISLFPHLATVSVVVNNSCLVSSKSSLVFLTFSLGVSDSLGNGQIALGDMISVLDIIHPIKYIISAWYSSPC